ncbi:hypothetical protein BDR07DRAFT_1417206 [Suillus spraguei]|nr:hypothetical protein BDR07DRAFT_1417206 [Suillus spraguei]
MFKIYPCTLQCNLIYMAGCAINTIFNRPLSISHEPIDRFPRISIFAALQFVFPMCIFSCIASRFPLLWKYFVYISRLQYRRLASY